jgi:hypothetical protein
LLAFPRFALSTRAGIPLRRRLENELKIVHLGGKSIWTHFHIGRPETPVLEKSTGTYDTKSELCGRASIGKSGQNTNPGFRSTIFGALPEAPG